MLAVTAVALVPMAVIFGERLPFAMQAGRPAPLVQRGGARPAAGRVLLSYPAPFSGLQSAMAWQAVNAMHYSQAGGGGPQGVAEPGRHGGGRLRVLSRMGFGIGKPEPAGTPAQYAAVRHALAVWQVNTVVVATDPAGPPPCGAGTPPTPPPS